MGNGANADVNGVGTAASYTQPQDVALMANNTFAFVVEGHAISQINLATPLKSTFVGVSSAFGTGDGSRTLSRPTLHHHLPCDDDAVRWRVSTNSASFAGW
jgi:hypothetical protein